MNTTYLLPETSDKCDVVLTQLMKAKADMGTAVRKDANNPFYKSKYASLGIHLDLCEPVLSRYDLIMVPTVNMVGNQPILVATLHHPESGQWLKTYLPLPNPKGDSQGVGASITYMRRYAINSLFSLNAEDDDGETAAGRGAYEKQNAKEKKKQEQEQDREQPVLVDQVATIGKAEIIELDRLKSCLDEESTRSFLTWIKTNFNATSIQQIPSSVFQQCVDSLNRKIKYLNDKNKQAVA